jgi:hypothetical protein
MIYSKRRRGGQRNHYTRKSFRVKRYKHYGGAGDKLWINDEEEDSINNLIDEFKKIKNPGDEHRARLKNQLETILSSIVNRAEKKKNDVVNELASIQHISKEIMGDENNLSNDDKARKAELRTLSTEKTKTLNEMRSNYQSAKDYKKSILDMAVRI